jgi:metal transporter CNNM
MLSTALARQTPGRAKNGGLVYSAGRLALVGLIHAALTIAAPLNSAFTIAKEHHHSDAPDEPEAPDDAALWIYLTVAIVLVLLGGAFAGLTIAYVPGPVS